MIFQAMLGSYFFVYKSLKVLILLSGRCQINEKGIHSLANIVHVYKRKVGVRD